MIAAILPILLYLLLRLLEVGRVAALLAAAALALSGNGVQLDTLLYGESMAAVAVLAAALVMLLAARKQSVAFAVASGLFLGGAILIRGYLILLPLVFAVWLFRTSQRSVVITFLVAAALLPAVWVGRNRLVTGRFTYSSESADVLWQGNNQWARGAWPGRWTTNPQHAYLLERHPSLDAMDEMQVSDVMRAEFRHDLAANPSRIAWLLPRKAIIFFSPRSYLGTDWIYLAILPLCVYCTARILRRGDNRQPLILFLGSVAAVLVVCLVSFGDPRFRHPIDAFIFGLVALPFRMSRPLTKDQNPLSASDAPVSST
jgi:hypothetical protein